MIKKLLFVLLAFAIIGCKEHEHDRDREHKEKHYKQHDDDDDYDGKHDTKDSKSTAALREELTDKGFQIFDYVDEKTKDTIIMQQYFIAFLKKGPNRDRSEEEAAKLQEQHLAHLGRMYELGYADISGPFGDDGDIRGITIYNVPTLKMADSLANLDPAVLAGSLEIEVHPWWAAKGFNLR